MSEGLEVRESRIYGRGCFATRRFHARKKIAAFAGELVRGRRKVSERLRGQRVPKVIWIGDDLGIDGAAGGDATAYINHSCEPNAYMRAAPGEKVVFFALRDILPGEEITADLIVGHNVFDFDLPFLYKRSVIHNVRPTVELPFTRYRSRPVFDTMHQWNKWSPRKFVSLDRLAKVLGLESSKGQGIDGSLVYDKFCEGCHGEIADYCMRDVELVRQIYYRMSFAEGERPGGQSD